MTIREIAQLCDLPTTTVYRALKTPNKVKPHILKQVESVLKTPYKPKSQLKKIYIVSPFLSTFHNLFLIHITKILSQKNILVTHFITDEDPIKEKYFFDNLTLSPRIGLIWCPSSNKSEYPFLKNDILPIVILYRNLLNIKTDLSIFHDNNKAIDMAIQELTKNGSKNILLLTGDTTLLTPALERKTRFQDIISNTPNIQGNILEANFKDWQSAYLDIKNSDISLTDYDAVISTNEMLTYGLINMTKQLNLDIPKDIQITSLEHTPAFDILSIRSIHFSAEEMATQAVDMLLQKSSDPDYKKHYSLPPTAD